MCADCLGVANLGNRPNGRRAYTLSNLCSSTARNKRVGDLMITSPIESSLVYTNKGLELYALYASWPLLLAWLAVDCQEPQQSRVKRLMLS